MTTRSARVYALIALLAANILPRHAAAEEMWRLSEVYGVLPKATNAEAHEYAGYVTDAGLMFGYPPDNCMKMLAPRIFGSLQLSDWGENVIFHARLADIQKRVVRTAATAPNPPPSEAEVRPVLDKILAELNKDDTTALLNEGFTTDTVSKLANIGPDSSPALTCHLWTGVHLKASSLPQEKGGMVIRWLYTTKIMGPY